MTEKQLELLLLLAQYHTLMPGWTPEIKEALEDVRRERDGVEAVDNMADVK